MMLSIRFCYVFFIFFIVGMISLSAAAQTILPRSAPEAQGVSSSEIAEFIEAANQIDAMHSFMLVRHGKVITEAWWAPYNAESNHVLYSLSKSFTSTAVGIAVAEGKLSLDDEVAKFFPNAVPSDASKNLKAMRVRDLLTMATGHQDEPPTKADIVSAKSFLAQPVPHLPGTHFKYNTAATFMCSAIVQKQTQQTILDYLRPRLFEPLGISNPVWDTNSEGISLGGYGLRVRTEDIAKFGQLYLQNGTWNGRQLIDTNWIQLATSKQVSNGSDPNSDWNQGYGFQFWRCRHNAYRGDGAFGQYCIVLPDQDTVIAITSGVSDMQGVLNIVWQKLLPALRPGTLPTNDQASHSLAQKLAGLKVRFPDGLESTPRIVEILGKKFSFGDNDQKLKSLSFVRNDPSNGLSMLVETSDGISQLPAGFQKWQNARGTFGNMKGEPVAASFAWPSEDSCTIKVCAYETPFHQTFRIRFQDGEVILNASNNVGFGPKEMPELIGKSE